MKAEQLISIYLETYKSMCRELGKDNDEVERLYAELKDMIVVEVYFMKPIRHLVKDGEMSGFILYFDKYLRRIVENYNGSRGCFMPYLKESAEKCALSYLEEQMCSIYMQSSYMKFHGEIYSAVPQLTPEDILYVKEEAKELKVSRSIRFKMLHYLCARNPVRRKKLFIFLCTMVPYLSRDVIDRFCESINCDRKQTLAIVSHLCRLQDKEESGRYSKSYLSRMVDFHWEKVLEHEGHAMVSVRPEKEIEMAEFHRTRLRESLAAANNAKMNVPYTMVAEVLNLDPTTVALYVMHSKRLLEKVLNSSPSREMLRAFRSDLEELPLFEPFSEFGIDTPGIPA